MKHWTDDETKHLRALLLLGESYASIAEKMGCPLRAVSSKILRLGLKQGVPAPFGGPLPSNSGEFRDAGPAAPAEDLAPVVDYWKRRAHDLEKDLAEGQHAKLAEEILAGRVLDMAPKSYLPVPNAPKHDHAAHGSPQSAVLLFSDTHIGAVVQPEQTLGLGQYSFDLFLRRLARLERSVHSIIRDHTATEVDEIVIAMLGDMLDGALVHSAECGQLNTLLSQFYCGGHAIAQFFRNLSTLAPLRIYSVVGNHTRFGQQHKMPTKNRNSNFDMLLALYVQALVRDIPTIKMVLSQQPFTTFEVQGYPFYGLHGDNIRGGDKILGLPAHGMGRMVGTTTQLFSRAQRDTPAYYVMGHLHRPIEVPHARGAILVNGAFPGIDNYALAEYFNSAHPIQKFFLMHPSYGRSATYDLRLDKGDGTPHHYTLPTEFTCV